MDPFGLTLVILLAAYLLRDEITTSSKQAERETVSARTEAQRVSTELRSQVEGLRRKQALDVLYSARRQYIAKADTYYSLKKEYGSRLHKLHEDVELLKSQKRLFYSSGRHSHIPELKQKVDELYSVVGQVKSAFKHYGSQVQEFNAATSEIKRLIESYQPHRDA